MSQTQQMRWYEWNENEMNEMGWSEWNVIKWMEGVKWMKWDEVNEMRWKSGHLLWSERSLPQRTSIEPERFESASSQWFCTSQL